MANELATASRYNIMQGKVAIVLGLGQLYLGYGQEVISSQVSRDVVIDDTHMNDLRTDMINAYVHQTGILPLLTTVNEGDLITEDIWLEYEAVANLIRANADEIFRDTQISTELKLTVTRKQSWGGDEQPQRIYHDFNVTFLNYEELRHFFNTGGMIEFNPSMVNTSGAKSQDWQALLSAISKVTYDRTGADCPTGFPETIGPLELTEDFQRIYIKTGSGIYAENTYTIEAKRVNNIITFSVEFYDGLANFSDEPVQGTLSQTIVQQRATGTYVEVPSPLYQNVKALS
mgnify:CR=1 FL=1